MWQEILTGIVVLGAVFYLVRRYFFQDAASNGCQKCKPGEQDKQLHKKA